MNIDSWTDADRLERAFVVLAVVVAVIHLYLGVLAPFIHDDATQFVVIGLALLVGPVVYLTPYWHPVFYLLGVGLAIYLATLWLLGGMQYPLFGAVVGAIMTVFSLLGLYLFVREWYG